MQLPFSVFIINVFGVIVTNTDLDMMMYAWFIGTIVWG